MKNLTFQRNWNTLVKKLEVQFGEGINLDAILFLIGVQELGMGNKKFKKNEKIDLMHIAICRLLSPYGYYEFIGIDEDGWPHYKILEKLPPLNPKEQSLLIKEAILDYFNTQEN